MSLTEAERSTLLGAGTTPSFSARRQAVTIVLSKSGSDRVAAEGLLAESFVQTTQPSFHLIPRGDAMASESAFAVAYDLLAQATDNFGSVGVDSLSELLASHPECLAPLRMVLGFTHNEMAVATRLVDPTSKVTGSWLRGFERKPVPATLTAQRSRAIATIVTAVLAVMDREILSVPDEASAAFHSKLDKRDTVDGWHTVVDHATHGVP